MERSSGSSRDRRKTISTKPTAVENAFVVARALIAGGALTSEDISALLGIDEPAARKYVALAETALGATRFKDGQKSAVRLDMRIQPPPSQEVAVAVCFGASLSRLFEGSAVSDGMRGALDYVVRASPHPKRFEALHRKFYFVRQGGEMALPERAGDLQHVVNAILREKRIRVSYVHFDGSIERGTLDPLSIAVYDHQLYVVARRKDGELHPYRFSRLQRVVMTTASFVYPDAGAYDPAALFRHSFGVWHQPDADVEKVEVLLTSRWRVYARTHRWCEGQKTEETSEGVVVTFWTRPCEELTAWALSFGSEIEVRSPASLVEAVESHRPRRNPTRSSQRPVRAERKRHTAKSRPLLPP